MAWCRWTSWLNGWVWMDFLTEWLSVLWVPDIRAGCWLTSWLYGWVLVDFFTAYLGMDGLLGWIAGFWWTSWLIGLVWVYFLNAWLGFGVSFNVWLGVDGYYEFMAGWGVDFLTLWLGGRGLCDFMAGVGGLRDKSLPLAALRLFGIPPETRFSYNGTIYNSKKSYCEPKRTHILWTSVNKHLF